MSAHDDVGEGGLKGMLDLPRSPRPRSPASTFPLLHKPALSRSKVNIINNNKSRKGDTPLFTALRCLFSLFSPVKRGAFIGPLRPRRVEDWVPPRCSEISLSSYYAARSERGRNPGHLYSHLSAHIHITKRACVREPGPLFFFSMCDRRRKEKRLTRGRNIWESFYVSLWFLRRRSSF